MGIIKLLLAVVRNLLKLRYKLEFKGADVIDPNKPTLILPNHQAVVDPMLLVTKLAKQVVAVPVMTESYYDIPVLHYFFKKWKVVRVADLKAGSRDTGVLDSISTSVIGALKNGQTVLLYPSGQITGQSYEKIFNKKSAYHILKELPDNTSVVGLRITGLWGSIWSRAWTGDSPFFGRTVLRVIWYVLANLVFFVPRRKVTMEFKELTDELKEKAQSSVTDFNEHLEAFYNQGGGDKLNFMKHYFYGRKPRRELPPVVKGSVDDVGNAGGKYRSVDPKVYKKIREILESKMEDSTAEISITANLHLDLGMDSITLVDVYSEISEHFAVKSQPNIEDLKSVGDLCLMAMNKLSVASDLKPSLLYQHKIKPEMLKVDDSKNILENYIKLMKTAPAHPFAYDSIMGSTNRKQFLMKSIAVSRLIKKTVKEERVGVMLPALQSSTLLVASCYLAGKVPVMLNWTVGKQVLMHCVQSAGVEVVLTATNFYNKIKDLLPEELLPKLVHFDKKLPELTLSDKLSSLFLANMPSLIPVPKLSETAVVLFTSGSENAPKAVELSHKNIIADIAGILEHIKLKNELIILGFLPPFHSFGFTILEILPMVAGLKAAYTPNPTDTAEIVKILRHTKSSLMVGTPTFLKNIMNIASAHDLDSLELVVSGAESMPEKLLEQFHKLNEKAVLIEGYGITECSPVVTVNPVEKQKLNSVGQPIGGCEIVIADIETNEKLPVGTEGMILIGGPNVFNGYVDEKIPSPFVDLDGKRFYVSGDLGRLDEEGYLFITGRLKRFIKKGGEMISLPFLERILSEHFGADGENPIAVEGTDKGGSVKIVLFTCNEVKKQDANAVLRENGVAAIAFVSEVRHVDELPMLGSGKTDYKKLKKEIEA